jgi:arginyl-tRNA synthetase
VVAGLRAVGLPAERVRLLMHQFISFKGGRMSTRRGNIVTVDDLLDEVGPDATRYLILQRSAESHLEFDLDLAVKQSKDNPVFYVLYAHTRAASILRKAREEHGLDWDGAELSLIAHPKELGFVRRALELEEVLVQAAERLEPHHLAFYAYELARALHAFYDDADCRVLPGDPPVPPELTRARLALARAAQIRVLRMMGMSTGVDEQRDVGCGMWWDAGPGTSHPTPDISHPHQRPDGLEPVSHAAQTVKEPLWG